MDINQLIQLFFGAGAKAFFFKSFAIIFSLLYFLFTIILQRQVIIMNRTLQTKAAFILVVISGAQIVFAFIIVFLAIFFI